MIVKVLVQNDFVEDEDRHEILEEFNESVEKIKKSPSKLTQSLNTFLMHPIGIMISLWGYVKVSSVIRKQAMLEQTQSAEEAFRAEMETRIMQKMLDQYER